jgi:hypothetical protein
MYKRGWNFAKAMDAQGTTRDTIWHAAQTSPMGPPKASHAPSGTSQREEWLSGVLAYVHRMKRGIGLFGAPPKRRRNAGTGMSFWKATIYSPTGKPIHRQVIQNTRAGAMASAKKLARSNPKVALDGPYKSPPAC